MACTKSGADYKYYQNNLECVTVDSNDTVVALKKGECLFSGTLSRGIQLADQDLVFTYRDREVPNRYIILLQLAILWHTF